jgi:hypothetical protein
MDTAIIMDMVIMGKMTVMVTARKTVNIAMEKNMTIIIMATMGTEKIMVITIGAVMVMIMVIMATAMDAESAIKDVEDIIITNAAKIREDMDMAISAANTDVQIAAGTEKIIDTNYK